MVSYVSPSPPAFSHSLGQYPSERTCIVTVMTDTARQIVPVGAADHSDRNKEKIRKCKNFLETLIRLSSQQPQQILDNVKNLIRGLLVCHYI